MKRFVDTSRFDDPWYAELPLEMKLAWEFLWSKCDCAGVWKPNMKLAEFQLGAVVNWEKFRELVGDRIKTLPSGWWIVDFVKSQCGELSPDCRAHIPVIKTLREHQLLQSDSLSIVYPMTTHSHKEQEQEKEQDKEGRKGAGKEGVQVWSKLPQVLDTPAFREQWGKWVKFRRDTKKRLTEETVIEQWNAMEGLGEEKAIMCIRTSIQNGWQGLFPEKFINGHAVNGQRKTFKEEAREREAELHKTESKYGF